jgi:hypothetical protein
MAMAMMGRVLAVMSCLVSPPYSTVTDVARDASPFGITRKNGEHCPVKCNSLVEKQTERSNCFYSQLYSTVLVQKITSTAIPNFKF